MTLATHNIYHEALKIGFDVKVVVVWLYKNWSYDIGIQEFNKFRYCIDKPKEYDKLG